MLRSLLLTTALFAGTFATAQAAPLNLPDGIQHSAWCTTYGQHGAIGGQVEISLNGSSGSYHMGQLDQITYNNDEGVVSGHWSAFGASGWFRWAFYDESGWYGSWGYGSFIGHDEQGYWNGKKCS